MTDTDKESRSDEWLPTRESLLSRLKACDDQESWTDFFNTYWKLIYKTALAAGLKEEEAQDVVQETVISVSKSMPGFQYDAKRGSFKAWLRQLTQWRIRDQLRKRLPARGFEDLRLGEEGGTDLLAVMADPVESGLERTWEEEWEKALYESALERVKRKADPKQFQLFDLYVVQQWPIAKIRERLKVSAGRIYIAKHRILGLVQKELEVLRTKSI